MIWSLERAASVAYKLRLPEGAHIHDVFHVALLKRYFGEPPADLLALPPLEHRHVVPSPEKVRCAHLNRGV